MTICTNCGKEIEPAATFCTNCGAPAPHSEPDGAPGFMPASQPATEVLANPQAAQPQPQPGAAFIAPAKPEVPCKGLKTAALVFTVIAMVFTALAVILLLGYIGIQALWLLAIFGWVAPMAVHIWDMRKGDAELSVEFAIITFVIGNIVAGTLLVIAWFIERNARRKQGAQ